MVSPVTGEVAKGEVYQALVRAGRDEGFLCDIVDPLSYFNRIGWDKLIPSPSFLQHVNGGFELIYPSKKAFGEYPDKYIQEAGQAFRTALDTRGLGGVKLILREDNDTYVDLWRKGHSQPQTQTKQAKKAKQVGQVNPHHTFGNYISTPANEEALEFGKKLTERILEGKNSYEELPPCFYGDSGMGKTHIAEGIIDILRKANFPVTYVHVGQLVREVSRYASKGQFFPIENYMGEDTLVVEALPELKGRPGTQKHLLAMLERREMVGKHRIFTSAEDPSKLVIGNDFLDTRIQEANPFHLRAPKIETGERTDFLEQLFLLTRHGEQEGEDIKATAEHLTKIISPEASIRELNSYAHRIVIGARARGGATRKPITPSLVYSVCKQTYFRAPSARERAQLIVETMAAEIGVDESVILGRGGGPEVSKNRAICMDSVANHSGLSLTQIGEFFDERTHSTIISARRTAQNPELQKQRDSFEAIIRIKLPKERLQT